MPNKNYVRGRKFEYKIMSEFRRWGCDIVLRSAGSHSPVDVVGFDLDVGAVYLAQAKLKKQKVNFPVFKEFNVVMPYLIYKDGGGMKLELQKMEPTYVTYLKSR